MCRPQILIIINTIGFTRIKLHNTILLQRSNKTIPENPEKYAA